MVALLLLILISTKLTLSQDISSFVDVKTLSELSLEKLLAVKNTFNAQVISDKSDKGEEEKAPEALALQKRKPHDRGGYYQVHYEETSKKSGKKSIQSIFQISVTALAFVAFGGYLLCLVVQAIKGKNMMMETTTVMPSPAAYLQPIRRKRPTTTTTRRPNRFRPTQGPTVVITTNGRRPKRDVWPEANAEELYFALVRLSEAYTSYHTIDYKRFNFSSSYDNDNY